MPNNVCNYLTAKGSQVDIDVFFAKAKAKNSTGDDVNFTFNAFVPMPDGEKDWYNWRLANWGTKWDCYEVKVESPCVRFETAWSVPVPVLLEMSLEFPGLQITNEWIEETTESAGVIVLKNGNILRNEHENNSAWQTKNSRYIHALNIKHDKHGYIDWLEKMTEGEPDNSVYHYYLSLTL